MAKKIVKAPNLGFGAFLTRNKKTIIIGTIVLAGLVGAAYLGARYGHDHEQKRHKKTIKKLDDALLDKEYAKSNSIYWEHSRDYWANLSQAQRDTIAKMTAHIIKTDPVAAKLNSQILSISEEFNMIQDSLNGNNKLSSDTIAWEKFSKKRDALRVQLDTLVSRFTKQILDSTGYKVVELTSDNKKSGNKKNTFDQATMKLNREIRMVEEFYKNKDYARIREAILRYPDVRILERIPDSDKRKQIYIDLANRLHERFK